MKMTKRILSLLLVCAMMLAMVACTDPQDGTTGVPGTTGNGNTSADRGNYTVKLTTAGGMALAGYQVMIYADEACTDIVETGNTADDGTVKFSLKKDGKYYIKLDESKLKGYDLKPYYQFDGFNANLTLTSSVVKGESVTANVFKLGDVMYDFSFTDNSGNTVTLSEVLAEKELVVLNYWYANCSWCVKEFPVLQQAYEMLGDNVEVFGLNSFAEDTAATVQNIVIDLEHDPSSPSWL